MTLNLIGTASPVVPSQKPESPTAAVAATTPTKSHRKRLSASSSGMPASPSQTTPRPPPQQQEQQQQQPVLPVLAIPPLLQTQSQQTLTPRSPVLHQQTSIPRAHGRRAYSVIPALSQGRTTRRHERQSDRECGNCPLNSTFRSQVQYSQISKLDKEGPRPSKTFAKSGVPSPLLVDPRAGGFARRLSSLAGRPRTSSLSTKSPDLPGEQTSTCTRSDSTAAEVFSDSEAVGPGGRRGSTFRSRFSAASSAPSSLHLRDSTGASGYSSSRGSGTLGRCGTVGRKFKGANFDNKPSATGPVPRLAVRTPDKEVERHLGEPLVAAANASPVEPVVVEEPEAYGDDEHAQSVITCAASAAGPSPRRFEWTWSRVQAAQGEQEWSSL